MPVAVMLDGSLASATEPARTCLSRIGKRRYRRTRVPMRMLSKAIHLHQYLLLGFSSPGLRSRRGCLIASHLTSGGHPDFATLIRSPRPGHAFGRGLGEYADVLRGSLAGGALAALGQGERATAQPEQAVAALEQCGSTPRHNLGRTRAAPGLGAPCIRAVRRASLGAQDRAADRSGARNRPPSGRPTHQSRDRGRAVSHP
jgi:hypothetical protein